VCRPTHPNLGLELSVPHTWRVLMLRSASKFSDASRLWVLEQSVREGVRAVAEGFRAAIEGLRALGKGVKAVREGVEQSEQGAKSELWKSWRVLMLRSASRLSKCIDAFASSNLCVESISTLRVQTQTAWTRPDSAPGMSISTSCTGRAHLKRRHGLHNRETSPS